MYTQTLLITTVDVFGLCLLVIVTSIFLAAQLRHDNSIMDILYGPTFLLAGLATAILLESHTWLSLLMLGLVSLWSLRLGIRIYRKNHGQPEDARYAAWRTLWKERGEIYFIIRSYLQINLLQGIIILIVASPLVISLSNRTVETDLFPLLWLSIPLGSLIFFCGLILESIADWQLDRFIAGKRAGTETATLMTRGLFRYSRRPNYFGESLIWWGLAIMVLPLPYGFIALLSPLLITYIVTRVTGPMLEKIFLERYPDEYATYMAQTSYFIPLPPKTK